MKKFTKVLESEGNKKLYSTSTTVEILIEAENEGEAGYKLDDILGSIEEIGTYTINDIKEKE